jgi:hypothetical protein
VRFDFPVGVTPKDVRAIIHELRQAEGLPKEALKAASAQRVEMVPVFRRLGVHVESMSRATSRLPISPSPDATTPTAFRAFMN